MPYAYIYIYIYVEREIIDALYEKKLFNNTLLFKVLFYIIYTVGLNFGHYIYANNTFER